MSFRGGNFTNLRRKRVNLREFAALFGANFGRYLPASSVDLLYNRGDYIKEGFFFSDFVKRTINWSFLGIMEREHDDNSKEQVEFDKVETHH